MADRLGLPTVSACHAQLLAELQADGPRRETRLHGPTAASSKTVRGDPIGDGSLAGLAEVMADACGRDSGRNFVVLADSGTLPTIKACLSAGILPGQLVLANENTADFAWGLNTARAAEATLGNVLAHGGGVEHACRDLGRAGLTAAAACVRVGREPWDTRLVADRVLATGALMPGSVLVLLPSMGQLERQGRAQQELDRMVAGVMNYSDQHGYWLEVDHEAGGRIADHARVLRVDRYSPPRVRQGSLALPTAATIVAVLRSKILVPPASCQVFLRNSDSARAALHLRLGCSGAEQCHPRRLVRGRELCRKCTAAYAKGQPLHAILRSTGAPLAPPTPPRGEVRHQPAVDAAPNLVLRAVGRGKRVHWSECQYVKAGRSRGSHIKEMTLGELSLERVRFDGACCVCTSKTGGCPVALIQMFQPHQ